MEQPLPEYTHHVLNLAINYACKNQSVKKFMNNLTAVWKFTKTTKIFWMLFRVL